MGTRAVDLAERSSRGRMVLELRELALPVVPQLGAHAALDEGPAHRGSLALQLGKLFRIFGWQRVRDGGQELRDLHDRPLEATERHRKLRSVTITIEVEAEQTRAREAGGYAPDIGADPGIARGAGGEAVLFLISHCSV